MKDKFLSKAVPRGTRTIWRYLSALILLFSLSIGQMWAADPDLAIGTDGQTSSSFLGEYSTEGITLSSSASYSSGAVQLGNTPSGSSAYNSHYFEVLSSSAEIEKVSFLISGNGSNKSIQAPVFAWASTATSNTADTYVLLDAVTVTANSYAAAKWFEYDLSGASVKCARIYRTTKNISSTDPAYTGSSTALGSGQTIKIYGIKVWLKASSGPVPVSSVAVTAPVDGNTYYVGDQVTLAATVLPANATNKTLNWTMDVSDKATIADGKITFTEAGDFHLTASATDGSGKSNKVHLYVSNPTLITSIALDYNEQHINVGDVITITPTILPATATNKNLLWSVTEGATITQEGVLTAVVQSDVIVTAEAQDGSGKSATTHIYIDPLPACATLTPATSGSAIAAGDAIDLQESAPNASMKALTANLSYTENGLLFGENSSTKVEVTLTHLMKEGTVITATIYNADASKARGLNLLNSAGTSKATWTKQATGDHIETYTVVAGDGLAGSNVFQLQRNNNAYLKDISIANCGAELFAINTVVSPSDPAGLATVSLDKELAAAGETVTATAVIADPTAYEFDYWEINGATLDDATVNPTHITMGSNPATITVVLKQAGTKYAVHFDSKGGSAVDDQLVDEGGHAAVPNAPTKFKYTFVGWSETDGGSTPANLDEIAINAEKTFYAIWTDKVCPTSGTIFSVSQNGSTPSSEVKWTNADNEGVRDVSDFFEVVNGIAALVNNSSSNNQVSITTTPQMKFSNDANGWAHLRLECALEEGDVITLDNTNKCIVSYTADKAEGTTYTLPNSTSHTITVPASWAGQDELYIFRNGSNFYITSISITRPAKFEVTFNMHDHGDAVNPQSVVEGGKVTKPTDPTASGWDFGGWFTDDTYGTTWDFENMTISAATEIHALWTVHTTSSDATLKDLTVNGVTVAGFDPATEEYNVVLEMGTTTTPEVAGVPNDDNYSNLVYVQTSDPTADVTVTVTAEDGSTSKTYTIHFSIATSKDINLVWATGTTPCKGTPDMSTQIKSNNAAVSTYINQITFTNVEGAGDDGAEANSLNVGKKAGNMFTLTAKPGYAFAQMHFFAKIQDANCEYSIDGSDWTELASANTGGNECYAPFSGTEVHEFRLRSTGANGVWIRNMQLNIIEACTPIVVAWDEEPLEFEVGKAGYAIAATANNGGTIAYGSSDASVIAVDAGNGVLSVSDLGSTTLSASTPEGDGTTYCENGGNDIVISKVVSTYFLVKFDAQNGEDPAEVKFHDSDMEVALPATDPSYPGHTFAGWFDAATGGNPVTTAFAPNVSMTIYAHWTVVCDAPTIVEHPESANYFTGRTADALECQATAAGGNALTYTWYSCDDAVRTNPIELSGAPTPSTAVAGTFYFFCAVTEEGCGNVAYSNVAVITVADKDAICLVKAELAPGSSAASITSTSGYYKDDANIAINVAKDLKLGGTGKYVKVAVEGTNFQDGDVVEITLASDKTASAWLQIFTDEGTTMVAEMTSGVSREHPNYLTISGVPANTKTLYLYRTEAADGNMNPYPTSMAVYRACAPILNKVTVAGVDGTPDNTNHVAIEVPNSTTDDALAAIVYDWVSNDAAWTADHEPAVANAWEWGVENTVTLTDKDGDASVYYVTISKAAASTDATLSALTVNGQAIALADGVFEYTFELPYGTSVVPTVVATPNHVAAVATVDPCTLSGATITVVPESGEDDKQVYTLTFVISKWQEVVIWDGSTMTEVATSPDAATGFAWAVNGFSSITNYNATCGTKAYTKTLPSGGSASTSRNVAFTVPEGYVAKFYIAFGTHSDGSNRGMFIASNAVKKLENAESVVLTLYSDSRTNLTDGTSEIVGAGTYYLDPMESVDFYEIRAYVRPGYGRTAMLGNGVLGTVCVDHNVAIEDIQGVTVYELVGREPQYGKVAFDEIVTGELEAGAPYVFQAHGDRMVLFYGEDKVDDPVDKDNGMYGTFVDQTLTELNDIYYFAQRALWSCVDLSSLSVPANRAYVKLSEIDYLDVNQQNPAPGRRRILMTVNGETQAQGIDDVQGDNVQSTKVLIDGTLYILRGEKVFDATGRLVK